MPTNDLHRAIERKDWGRAGALLGLGEGADPHPDAKRLCAEKGGIDGEGLPLELAVSNEAPPAVLDLLRKASGLGLVLQCKDWEAIERLGLITPEACAAKHNSRYGGERLPLHWALHKGAPEGVVLAIIDAHPQVRRHAESRRTKELSPLGPRAAVSWLWVLAWGPLEPSRRGGENAQKTGKNRGKMGETWSKTCEQGKERRDHLGRRRVPCTLRLT